MVNILAQMIDSNDGFEKNMHDMVVSVINDTNVIIILVLFDVFYRDG